MPGPFKAVSRFFTRTTHNDQYASLMGQIASIAIACGKHFSETKAQDIAGVVEYERQADSIVEQIRELLDNSFIMRFDITDSMRLTDDLDDIIDGMRKVVLHVDSYRPYLNQMRPEAEVLIALANDMLVEVDALIQMLSAPRLSLPRVREVANRIDAMESSADKIVSDYEKKLVAEFSTPGANAIAFIAWHQLFHLLERMTDDANHCARQVLSLARKEA